MEQLRIFQKGNMTKKEAARIVHEYIRNQLHEEDVEDIDAAECLRDLYDCHACVNHIAQTFLKGIILPKTGQEYGVNEMLSLAELQGIEERVFCKEKRRPPQDLRSSQADYIELTSVPELEDALIIDVRMPEEFSKGHPEGAVNIPLHRINLNPYIVSDDRFRRIIFICDNGTNAKIAADIAKNNGFKSVYYTKYAE